MKYRNTHPESALEFSFGKDSYTVPCGGVVEVDDKWAPWVASRGLYLEAVVDTSSDSATIGTKECLAENLPETQTAILSESISQKDSAQNATTSSDTSEIATSPSPATASGGRRARRA